MSSPVDVTSDVCEGQYMLKYLATAALSALPASCGALASPAPELAPPVVVVREDHGRIDVSPPTRLDIVMTPSGDLLARCDDMGGRLVGNVCEGVDY